MRKFKYIGIIFGSLFALCLALYADTWSTTRDFRVNNTADTVKLTIQCPGTMTSNLFEVYQGSVLEFAIPPGGLLAVDYGGTGANSAATARTALGVPAQTDGTLTNVTVVGASVSSVTNTDLTASSVVFADANQVFETKTAGDARTALGVPADTGGTLTNVLIVGASMSTVTNTDLTASSVVFADADQVLETKTAGDARTALGVPADTGGSLTNVLIVGASMSTVTNTDLTVSSPVWASDAQVLETKTVAATKIAFGIQAGSVTTGGDGTVTATFGTAFSSAPIVILTPVNCVSPTNHVNTITETNCLVTIGEPSIVVNWIAIGAP